MTLGFERTKAVYALYHEAIVIGYFTRIPYLNSNYGAIIMIGCNGYGNLIVTKSSSLPLEFTAN
jgi:hypothetical protein